MMQKRKNRACILKVADVTYISRVHRSALALHDAGYDVVVLSVIPRNPADVSDLPYRSFRAPIKGRRFSSKLLVPLRAVEGLIRLFREALRIRADIYLPHDVFGLVIAFLVGKLTGAKIIYNADELEGARDPQNTPRWISFLNAFRRLVEKSTCRRIEGVIAADHERAEVMMRWYDLQDVGVVRNVPMLWSGEADGRIRAQLNLGDESFIMLYQGLLTPGRGVEMSIRALAAIDHPDVHLTLLGFVTNGYRYELERLATSEGVSHNVHFLAAVPWNELLDWTADADATLVLIENVCLSFYTAAPNKFYETMMAGVPYVASDFPEMRRVHGQAPAGILVDPSNLQEVTDAIDVLLADIGLRNEMGERGREAALSTYNWEKEKSRLVEYVSKATTTVPDTNVL